MFMWEKTDGKSMVQLNAQLLVMSNDGHRGAVREREHADTV